MEFGGPIFVIAIVAISTIGWVMTTAAFLKDKKNPSDAEIRDALSGLKCRCGTHMGIIRAVKRAATMMG